MAERGADRLAETERVVTEIGSAGEPLTTSEVADALGLTRRATYERLTDLADRGVLETKKVGARGRVWWREPARPAESGAAGEETALPFTEAVLDVQPDVVYAYDTERRLKRWNDRVPAVTGYAETELADMRMEEFVPPAYRDAVAAEIDGLIESGGTKTMDVSVLTAEGETIPYEVTGSTITDEDGAVTGVAGIGRDVSERVAQASQLRRERDFSDQLIEATSASIAVFARDGTVVRANERAATRLGIDESDDATVGPAELDVYDADGKQIPPGRRPVPTAFETGGAVTDFHCQLDLPVGGLQWLSIDAIPLGEERPVDRVLVTATDITELKHRTQQLERERTTLETELEEVFARVDDGFVALDHDLRFTFVNERATAIVERSAEELLGRPLTAVFPSARGSRPLATLQRAMETQSADSFEVRWAHTDSWLEVTVYPSETGLSVYLRDVTERTERQRALQKQREHLAALHTLNGVVREIHEAVLRQSTRADIERLVCERLAATDSYAFAWIGDGGSTTDSVEVRVAAGVDGCVDDVDLDSARTAAASPVPVGRALREGETQVCTDVDSPTRFPPWEPDAGDDGTVAVVAIPIVHEDATYGVLVIYAGRAGAFTAEERAVVSHLGEVVGHAIAAVGRKRALMSDDLVEIELAVPEVFGEDEREVPWNAPIELDQAVPTGDDEYVLYGSTAPAGVETLHALEAARDHWRDVTVRTVGDEARFEVGLSQPPIISAIAGHGGSVAAGTIDAGEYHVVVHLPASVDVRSFVDAVRDTAPSVTVVARRQVATDRSIEAVATDLEATLTDRQRATLEASYAAGYFDWPRVQDGTEVAATLGVSPPTFHQHLRAAQRKLLDALLS